MGDRTKIEWTVDADGKAGSSWTPIRAKNKASGKVGWFCTKPSSGCKNCYAESLNLRLGTKLPFKPGHLKDVELFLDKKMLKKPLRYRRARFIFACSMTDMFGEFVPDEHIWQMLGVMAATPQHIYQILTKRPDRMLEFYLKMAAEQKHLNFMPKGYEVPRTKRRFVPFPQNIWFGTSVEDQRVAHRVQPLALMTKASIRWISYEPAIGPFDPARIPVSPGSQETFNALSGEILTDGVASDYGAPIDLIVAGGESQAGKRPYKVEWFSAVKSACHFYRRSYFQKQMDKEAEIPPSLRSFDRPACHLTVKDAPIPKFTQPGDLG